MFVPRAAAQDQPERTSSKAVACRISAISAPSNNPNAVVRICLASAFRSCPILSRARLIALLSSQNRAPCCFAQLYRFAKTLLCGRLRRGLLVLQGQLALDAQELWSVPLFLPGVTSRQSLLDQREAGSNFIGISKARREFAREKQEARQISGVAGLVQLVAQQRQSGVEVAAPGDNEGLESGCPKPPQAYAVTVGMFQQIRAVAFRGIQIASQIGDRARALPKDTAERQGMVVRASFFDILRDQPRAPDRPDPGATGCAHGSSAWKSAESSGKILGFSASRCRLASTRSM